MSKEAIEIFNGFHFVDGEIQFGILPEFCNDDTLDFCTKIAKAATDYFRSSEPLTKDVSVQTGNNRGAIGIGNHGASLHDLVYMRRPVLSVSTFMRVDPSMLGSKPYFTLVYERMIYNKLLHAELSVALASLALKRGAIRPNLQQAIDVVNSIHTFNQLKNASSHASVIRDSLEIVLNNISSTGVIDDGSDISNKLIELTAKLKSAFDSSDKLDKDLKEAALSVEQAYDLIKRK